ncbi:hypothetical protein ECSTECDG1313_3785 [Escherichia coli STEC_DG131-3]|nr:hypothetical protein ECSTECDG1313_3785 [Escherichia coli STEC_DG131-3]
MLSVFPAPAGINRHANASCVPHESVPRASGDKPVVNLLVAEAIKCSPRQRG